MKQAFDLKTFENDFESMKINLKLRKNFIEN